MTNASLKKRLEAMGFDAPWALNGYHFEYATLEVSYFYFVLHGEFDYRDQWEGYTLEVQLAAMDYETLLKVGLKSDTEAIEAIQAIKGAMEGFRSQFIALAEGEQARMVRLDETEIAGLVDQDYPDWLEVWVEASEEEGTTAGLSARWIDETIYLYPKPGEGEAAFAARINGSCASMRASFEALKTSLGEIPGSTLTLPEWMIGDKP